MRNLSYQPVENYNTELTDFLATIKQAVQAFDKLEDEDLWGCENQDNLAEYLDGNYRVLGNGSFSVVLECPWDDTKVIKVGTGCDMDGDVLGDGWLCWAAFCLDINHDGRYEELPIIHALLVEQGLYVAMLDKLDCTYESFYFNEAGNPLYEQVIDTKNRLLRDIKQQQLDWMNHPACPPLNDTRDANIMVNETTGAVVLTDPCGCVYSHTSGVKERNFILQELGILPKEAEWVEA